MKVQRILEFGKVHTVEIFLFVFQCIWTGYLLVKLLMIEVRNRDVGLHFDYIFASKAVNLTECLNRDMEDESTQK